MAFKATYKPSILGQVWFPAALVGLLLLTIPGVVLIGNDLRPQTLNPNGSLVVKPITNTTYTLTAYGPGGQTVSVTISVFVR